MKGQLYSVYVLTVLAAIFAVTNLVGYIAAGIDNTDNFTGNLIPLIIAACFAVATFTMYKKHPVGWITFLIGIVLLLVQTILSITLLNIVGPVTSACIYLFMIFYLIDDHVMRMFGLRK